MCGKCEWIHAFPYFDFENSGQGMVGSGLPAHNICQRGSGLGAGKKPQAERLASETHVNGKAGIGMRFATNSKPRQRFEIKTRPSPHIHNSGSGNTTASCRVFRSNWACLRLRTTVTHYRRRNRRRFVGFRCLQASEAG